MVKVVNNKKRLYNGVKFWGIVDIPEEKVLEYTIAWFSVIEEKTNIVKTPVVPAVAEWIDENWTVNQLKEKLNHFWVDFSKCKNKEDYQKLLSKALKTPVVSQDDNPEVKTVDDLKTQLITEKIVEASELEGKTDDEVLQIATDNWLID